MSIVEKHPFTPPNSNVSVALGFLNQAFAASSGKQTSLVSMRPVTDLLSPGFFWVVLSRTADFGTSTITGKKRDSLRNSSGIPEAGTKTKSSSRKSIGFALGSVLGCLDGEIGVFIVAAFEMPLYSACLAQLELPTLWSKGIRCNAIFA